LEINPRNACKPQLLMDWERGFDPGVFGGFDLAALAQPHLEVFVCLFVYCEVSYIL
jgi:hypothetical protein